ncbi:MAG: hypothetical protein AAF211_05090 [Myxococcota bacterium]
MYIGVPPWMQVIGGCHEAVGTWEAAWVASGTGVSTAAGHLEIGPDGVSFVDIEFAGPGPTGVLRARGWTDLENASTRVVGRLDDYLVSVSGACRVDGPLLACFVDVDGDDWELWFRQSQNHVPGPLGRQIRVS